MISVREVEVPRLRRTSTAQPGWTRRRAGRGFVYLDSEGRRLPPEAVARIKSLAIPPAWKDLWICPWPNGHLQAVGTDEAGRRQYLYHEHWRRIRDRQKYDRAVELADRLPQARAAVAEHLSLPGMPRARALATAFRMLDIGALRIGGERYAEAHASFGLATLKRDHVSLEDDDAVRIRFTGKGGRDHEILIRDPQVSTSLRVLLDRDDPGERLLAWEEDGQWREVASVDVNSYIHEVTGLDVTAKDFRTWHGTAVAAAALADWAAAHPNGTSKAGGKAASGNGAARRVASAGGRSVAAHGKGPRGAGGKGARGAGGKAAVAGAGGTLTARKRAVVAATREVAEHLGNTPTVARTSYIDPRVVERFLDGAVMPVPPGAVMGEPHAMAQFEAALREWLAP